MSIRSALKIFAENAANLLNTRPLAVFSVLAFVFSAMRLYFPVEPLFLMCIIISGLLITLKLTGKITSFLTVFICVSMCLGMSAATGKIEENQRLADNFGNDFARIEGHVVSIPQDNAYSTSFYFKCERIQGNRNIGENVKVLVRLDDNLIKPEYGDRLVLNCVLKSVEEANARLSKNYLSKGVALVADDVVLLKKGEAEFPESIISSAQKYILSIANRYFDGDTRELLKALLAGERSGFSSKLTRNLNISGVSHLTCVSGLHVSVLGMAIYNLLRKKNKYLSATFALLAVWFFAILTGASPSTVRAAIMFTSYMIARIALAENDSLTALSFSAMILALLNPYVIFDWGFILSFLSVLGILLLSQTFKQMLNFLPEFVADSISVTVSAQLMTIPAIVNMFGYLSVYSIIANLVLSTVFLAILYLCFIFVFVANIPFLNVIFASVCTLFLDIIAVVSNFFADMPFSIAYMNYFDVFEVAVYYTMIMLFVFRKQLSEYVMSGVMIVCSIILVVASFAFSGAVYTYDLSENSYVLCGNEKNVLLACDNLVLINNSIDELGEIYIDEVIIVGDADSQLSGFIEIEDKINKVHISEEYADSDFCSLAYRMGTMVEFYPQDTELEEYMKLLLE